MRLGGHLGKPTQALQAWLHSSNSGITPFPVTRWWVSRWDFWALDITQSDQPHRIGGVSFTRKAGTGALYRPKLRFEEWQEQGRGAYESWVLFTATGQMRDTLLALTERAGYCHFQDPEQIMADHLKRISEILFHRRSGFQWLAQAAFLSLLAFVVTSHPVAPLLRIVRTSAPRNRKRDMPAEVENHIRAHIAEPLRVEDLARHVRLGPSAFAHAYRRLAGESPHRTILRLKMEAAKRLLVQDGFSVKETADRLGFSSEFQFSRCFKRLEGLAPTGHVRAMTTKKHQ